MPLTPTSLPISLTRPSLLPCPDRPRPAGGYNSTLNLTLGWPIPTGVYDDPSITVTPLSFNAPVGLAYFETDVISSSWSLAVLVVFDLDPLPAAVSIRICKALSQQGLGGSNSTNNSTDGNNTICSQSNPFPIPQLCGECRVFYKDTVTTD